MMKETILSILTTAHRHQDRLLWATTQMQAFMPLSNIKLAQLSLKQVAYFDLFINSLNYKIC